MQLEVEGVAFQGAVVENKPNGRNLGQKGAWHFGKGMEKETIDSLGQDDGQNGCESCPGQ